MSKTQTRYKQIKAGLKKKINKNTHKQNARKNNRAKRF